MPRKTFWLVFAIVGSFSLWCAVTILFLLYGNDWWLSGLMTLTVFAWLAGLLVVLFQEERIRSVATGAVIASAAYWLLALGPWFGSNVGPSLLTSRCLASADLWLHGSPQQTQSIAWTSYPSSQPVYLTGSGVVNAIPSPGGPNSFAFINTTAVPAGGGTFQPVGHWMLVWLCAGIGGCAALVMQIFGDRKKRTPRGSAGESPFAPTSTVPSERSDSPAPTSGAAS